MTSRNLRRWPVPDGFDASAAVTGHYAAFVLDDPAGLLEVCYRTVDLGCPGDAGTQAAKLLVEATKLLVADKAAWLTTLASGSDGEIQQAIRSTRQNSSRMDRKTFFPDQRESLAPAVPVVGASRW